MSHVLYTTVLYIKCHMCYILQYYILNDLLLYTTVLYIKCHMCYILQYYILNVTCAIYHSTIY